MRSWPPCWRNISVVLQHGYHALSYQSYERFEYITIENILSSVELAFLTYINVKVSYLEVEKKLTKKCIKS